MLQEPQKKNHLLIIDPDVIERENINAFLEDSGYKVTLLTTGLEAIDWLKDHQPDLIITEMELEHYNGLEILKKAQESDYPPPVIIMTTSYDQSLVVEAMRLGVADYLVKPIPDVSLLERVVKQSLEHQRLRNENKRFQQILMEDQEAGSLVQAKSLAKHPYKTDNYEIDFLVQPMLYLSGDVVDYIEVDEQFLIFYLSDVSGHGSAAAFVTILIKMFIRDAVQKYRVDGDRRVLNPDQLVSALADEIYTAKLEKYCTILYFVYDKQLEELRYTIAGNYPSPVVCEKGQARYLEGKGFPVGISSSLTYTTNIIELSPPYELYLFSDGIFELMSGQFEDKDQHLLDVISQGARTVIEIDKAFHITTATDPQDDTAVFIFKRGVPNE